MLHLVGFIVFILVAVTILSAVHIYIYRRLVRDLALPARTTRLLRWLLIAAGVLLPIAMILGRMELVPFRALLVWPAFLWLGLMFLLFSFLLIGEIARAGHAALAKPAPTPELQAARRTFLSRVIALPVAVVATGLSSVGVAQALRPPRLRKVRVPLSRLPQGLSGLTLAQITDLHVGQTVRQEYVENVVARINALAVDAVVITGDLVDGSVPELAPHVAPLANLRSKYGTFFVTGNHEYYSGAEAWIAHLQTLGIRVLHNEHAVLGQGDDQFDLVGVDDSGKNHPLMLKGHGANVPLAVAGTDPRRFKILLAHQPKEIRHAVHHGIDLQLSGHTHGGQLWPWGYLVGLTQPYLSGLHLRDGKTWIYVSCGTGYWGPPMRIGTVAEITHITLVRDGDPVVAYADDETESGA